MIFLNYVYLVVAMRYGTRHLVVLVGIKNLFITWRELEIFLYVKKM